MSNRHEPGHGGKLVRYKLAMKFLRIVLSIVGSFFTVAGVAAYAYLNSHPDHIDPRTTVSWTMVERPDHTQDSLPEASETPETEPEKDGGLFQAPKKTNFLILGTDESDLLTDVIIVGCFDRDTYEMNLISIPRDTYVTLPEDRINSLRDLGMHPPSHGIMKMNSVHSYSGGKYGPIYAEAQLMDILGIEFDYYIKINLEAFRKIVDTVGGVDMEIPNGGLYYHDPVQNLVINVPGGLVHLDGNMAEGVVRYRATYRQGDLQRIDMQHEFLKELYKQVLNRETIMNNASELIGTIISYVKTDFPIGDIPKYLKYINNLSADKLHMQTLPGEAQTINGASYFIHDPEATMEMAERIFRSDSKHTQIATPVNIGE